MLILNLGCGSKTADACVNIDWSPYLLLKKNVFLRMMVAPFIGKRRRERLAALDCNVVVHDLRRSLPFAESSVDAVYHSHVLEHIDRDKAGIFVGEIRRVLKPGGIHRICVPDMERLARDYLMHFDKCVSDSGLITQHDMYIGAMLEQCVRKDAYGSAQRTPLMRFIEDRILGDARARGETHQWMYDRFNCQDLLERCGFRDVVGQAWNESAITDWQGMGLEIGADGKEYKPGSLYVECRK